MNKIMLGLIAAVFILGSALVLSNYRQTPEPSLEARGSQPPLPDFAASQTAGGPRLKELPALPEGIQKETAHTGTIHQGSALRAPVTGQTESQSTAPGAQAETKPAPQQDTSSGSQIAATQASRQDATPGVQAGATQPARQDAAPRTQAAQAPRQDTTPKVQAGATQPARQDATPRTQAEAAQAAKQDAAPETRAEASPAPRQEAEARSVPRRNVTPKIVVYNRENGATVRIILPAEIHYRQMVLTGPDRIVMDITGEFKELRAPGVPQNPLVANVRIGHYDNRTRIVVDLKEKPRRNRAILSLDRQQLDIRVDR